MSHSPVLPAQPILKRKRISVACNSCRTKKVKCDGRRPICGRCAGYSYYCTWPAVSRRQESSQSPQPAPTAASAAWHTVTASEMLEKYQQLVSSVCAGLPDSVLSQVHASLDFIQTQACAQIALPVDECTPPSPRDAAHSPRTQGLGYLGETSDVRFVNNLIRTTHSPDDFSGRDARDSTAEELANYDSEQLVSNRPLSDPLAYLPCSKDTALDYLENYFTTIHIAYPFVRRRVLISKFETLLNTELHSLQSHSWLSLLYALLAIGAYYGSFRQKEPQTAMASHQSLFRRSTVLSELNASERSITRVSALLGQCFYLLAASEIERCLTLLGIAIRLGQSIGLHMNVDDSKLGLAAGDASSLASSEDEEAEMPSKVWYSLYVLDRLLALQLGRPPAIADQDCHVSTPSPIREPGDDSEKSYGGGLASLYFIHVIKFSTIIGQVLHEIQCPPRDLVTRLDTVAKHNGMLLGWKSKLPRHLRFDLGHVFDKSVTLRRQRNMLAIKFHHLQTLIHRPYLCYPHLFRIHPSLYHHHHQPQRERQQPAATEAITYAQHNQIQQYGRTCEQEARAIIHLIHNVGDAEDIVLNYPWWQMISCIMCAGSVLVAVLAHAMHHDPNNYNNSNTNNDNTNNSDDNNSPSSEITNHSDAAGYSNGREAAIVKGGYAAALSEDVEVCVQILGRLSVHSTGARRAWRMMKNIIKKQSRPGLVVAAAATTESQARPYPASAPLPSTSPALAPAVVDMSVYDSAAGEMLNFEQMFGENPNFFLDLLSSPTTQMEWPGAVDFGQ
ncbi:fungal-specific transcription factor domain-containing protein [Nemania diffusa]|nr:fungal-specific transcription factor domain-containing protein [Nemania diffusa]